jgi:hypothetical protein
MKKKLLFIIALIVQVNLSAQTEFMPIGATVHSEFYSYWAKGGNPSIFYAQKDTIVDGIVCRKVLQYVTNNTNKQKGLFTLLFKQKNDSIFEYDNYRKTLNFLFKNRYSVGDSFRVKAVNNNKKSIASVFIDSVVPSNGIKRYSCRLVCDYQTLNTQDFVRFNLYDKFMPELNWYLADMCGIDFNDAVVLYSPLCYTDKTTNYQTPLSRDGKCNPFSPIEEMDYSVKIFPNPADSYISVLTNQQQNVRLSIRNIEGKEVFRTTLLTPKNVEINHLPDGFYIVSVENDKGNWVTQKLIVHH